MKFNRAAILLTGSMTVLATASTLPIAQAQDKTEVKADVQRIIPTKNVPPALLAHWIDPKNNLAPQSLFSGNQSVKNTPTGAKGEPVFLLPEGVKKVSPILAPQLGLLVVGTEEGVRSVLDTIAFLDRPLKQVEIESLFVDISNEELKAFGVEFGANKTTGFEMGFVRGNFQSALNKALTEKRAKLITAPRVTAINNMQAKLNWTSQVVVPRPTIEGPLYTETSYSFLVTPTINNDNTVTLLMEAGGSQQPFEGINTPANLPMINRSIANMRDGDTIVLKGYLRQSPAELGKTIPAEGMDIVLFVTPRIVRQAEKPQDKRAELVHF
ncbi:MAG: hypothetical protein EOP10_16785 [Proteobacteria bacterium]|nr:MAG: hypothetical protein EOP10_16785 [Pseudomonadota bacterium]